MIRFVGKLLLLSVLFGLIVIVMHVIAIVQLRDRVHEAYSIADWQRYLFIGSSQLGCAVEERKDLHNKVLWVSDTSAPAWHLRLLELERRGQLRKLLAVIVPYNHKVSNQQSSSALKWAYYQELPVSFRYLDLMPFSAFDIVAYMSCNLRFPLPMKVCSGYPRDRPAISRRPDAWRKKHLSEFVSSAKATKMGAGCLPEWECITRTAYRRMQELCKRHAVRFVVYRQPILDQCYNALPGDVKAYEEDELLGFRKAGMEVLDLPRCFDDTVFFDSVHFMEQGTRMFTDLLFKKMGLQKEPKR